MNRYNFDLIGMESSMHEDSTMRKQRTFFWNHFGAMLSQIRNPVQAIRTLDAIPILVSDVKSV